MGYAFISYSSKNQVSADAMRTLLKKHNIDTWMAPYDIPAGSSYMGEINRAVAGCACLVLMLSEAAQNSQWVMKEVERAVTYKKPLIPVQIEDIILNDDFGFVLGSCHVVAVRKIDENSIETQKVLNSVIALTGQNLENSKHRSDERITIPLEDCRIVDTIEGKSLLAYYGKERIVKIPDGISVIDMRAFYACESLQEVYLPDTLEKIRPEAFYGCVRLQKIIFPKALRSIGKDAFLGCKQLEEVRLPLGATFFPFAFEKGIAVYRESMLKDIVSPQVVISQDLSKKFFECSDKKEFFKIEQNRLDAYMGIKEKVVVIPEGVEVIGRYAFLENSKLEEVILPQTLKKIEMSAFDNCKKLKKVHIFSNINIDAYAFSGCDNLETTVVVRVQ